MQNEFNVNRRSAGQWMTRGNPFAYEAVKAWLGEAIHNTANTSGMSTACEPYAGKLSLVRSLSDTYPKLVSHLTWDAYDIEPAEQPDVDGIIIQRRNTLTSLPKCYDIIVTNPPYLARNSARRRGLDFPFDLVGTGIAKPADLYQIALDTCLANVSYAAMLIPESFLTSTYDKTRCSSVVSLPAGMFDDTDCPVCLALFTPHTTDDVRVYANDGSLIGGLYEIKQRSNTLIGTNENEKTATYNIVFNDPHGDVALFAVDGTSGATIRFDRGDAIKPSAVKQSSRSLTRISRSDGVAISDDTIAMANDIIKKWREETNDVTMTAFKGVRRDGRYRRRISFAEARSILVKAIEEGSFPSKH